MVQLRQSPSGPPIRGTNPGDQLFWDGNQWLTAPGGGGGGLPPGSALGQLLQWNGSAWVLTGDGASAGQVLTWNDSSSLWEPQTPASGQTAWDHVITDLTSWEAAVGPAVSGVYTMPSGSYALKADLQLNGNDRIVIPNDAKVLFKSMGNKALRADVPGGPTLWVEVGGSLIAEQLIVRNLNTSVTVSTFAIRCDGEIQSSQCQFLCLQPVGCFGATMSGGLWIDFGSRFRGTTEGIRCDAASSSSGELYLNGTRLSCGFTPGTSRCLRVTGPMSTVSLQGAFWLEGLQNKPDGVRIEAPLTSLQMNGGEASGLDDAVQHVSGPVGRASIMNFSVAGSVSNGIDWPTANIPSPQGLTLIGNIYNTSGAAHQNFSATDPRVVVRGCLDTGGPMAETPIVP